MMPDFTNFPSHKWMRLSPQYVEEIVRDEGFTALERGVGFTRVVAAVEALALTCEPLAGPADGREPEEWMCDAMLAYHLERRDEDCARLELEADFKSGATYQLAVEYWRERARRAELQLHQVELRRRSQAHARAFRWMGDRR